MIKRYRKRSTWLAARRQYIGASESPTLLGHGYADQSPFRIWHSKLYGEDDGPTKRQLRIGQVVEASIRQLFQEETYYRVQLPPKNTYEVHYSDSLPFIGATLDGLIDIEGQACPVEIKNVGQWNADDWKDDQAPLAYRIQLAHQQAVLGAETGILCALVGGQELVIRQFERNHRFEEALLDQLKSFWSCVESREPPATDGLPGTAAALARMFGDDTRSEAIILPRSDTLAKLCEVREQLKELEQEKSQLENDLKLTLGECEYGLDDSGQAVSWKWQERTVYEVPDEVKQEYAGKSRSRVFRVLTKLPRNVEIKHEYSGDAPAVTSEREAEAAVDQGGLPRTEADVAR